MLHPDLSEVMYVMEGDYSLLSLISTWAASLICCIPQL